MDVDGLLARHQALVSDPLMARLRGEYHARQEAEAARSRVAEIARLEAEVSHGDTSVRRAPEPRPLPVQVLPGLLRRAGAPPSDDY